MPLRHWRLIRPRIRLAKYKFMRRIEVPCSGVHVGVSDVRRFLILICAAIEAIPFSFFLARRLDQLWLLWRMRAMRMYMTFCVPSAGGHFSFRSNCMCRWYE